MQLNDALLAKYTVKTTPIKNRPGSWDSMHVEILQSGTKVGEYVYNYSLRDVPFHPFVRDGKEYALYAKDYTATRVLSLPDCVDLGGEERAQFGFCPVNYAVPYEEYAVQTLSADDPEPPSPRHEPALWKA